MVSGDFVLPVTYDLVATLLFAATGALLAVKKGFDPLGVGLVAVVSGAGGGILRDAVFLNIQPAFIDNWRYIVAVFIGLGLVLGARSLLRTHIITNLIIVIDAIGIGMYGVFGAQKSLAFGLSIFAAIIVGVVSATGGSMLRDIVTREDPKNLLPGQLYGLLAVFGVLLFLLLHSYFDVDATIAAWIAIGLIFVLRILAIKFDWRTKAVVELTDPSELLVSQIRPLPHSILESQQKIMQYPLRYDPRHKKEHSDDEKD